MTSEKKGADPCECAPNTFNGPDSTIWGATPDEWRHFVDLGLTADLLPVVSNPNAVKSEASKIGTPGKLPSKYNGAGRMVGLANWTDRTTTERDVDRWSQEPDYGICLQTRNVRAIDVDVDDFDRAADIEEAIKAHIGYPLPCRRRGNSCKFLIPFRLAGDYTKRIIRVDRSRKYAIEFLATGQQFVAVGTHPSGTRYAWKGGLPAVIPTLTPEQFEGLWTLLAARFGDGESVTVQAGAAPDRPRTAADADDPLLAFLNDRWTVFDNDRSGRVDILCPFADGHTDGISEGSSTSYFPAGVGGFDQGHFRCLHASCAHRTDHDFKTEIGWLTEGFDEIEESKDAERPAPKPSRFRLLSGADLEAIPPISWRVKGILPTRGIAAVYGPSGSGKSFLTFDLCCTIASGCEAWFGYRVKPAPVVYLALEGQAGFRLRVEAWKRKTGRPLPATLHMVLDPFRLNEPDDVKELAPLLPSGAVVVVDTLAQATPGADENSGADMGRVLDAAKRIAHRVDGLVLLIAHTGKDASKGLRGWSGVIGALDAAIETSGERGSLVKEWRVDKSKDSTAGQQHAFTLEVVSLGVDDDLDPLTSCVVSEGGAALPAARKVPKGAAFGLDTLREACGASGEDAVHVEVWREAFYRRTTADTPAAKRQAFNRARGDLVALHLVTVESDHYSPVGA